MVVTPSFTMSGSIKAGTARHGLDGVSTEVTIGGDASDDELRAVVDQAERMCFVLDAIEGTHRVDRSVVVTPSTG